MNQEEAQKWKHVLEKSAHLNREETRKGDPESSQQVSQESEDSGGKDKSRFSKGSESQVETGFILRTPPPPLPRNAYLSMYLCHLERTIQGSYLWKISFFFLFLCLGSLIQTVKAAGRDPSGF